MRVVSRTFFGKASSLPPRMSGMSSRGYVRPPMAMGSVAWAFAVASSAVSLDKSLGQAGDGCRQIADATAGDVLLIQVVLLEQGEPLQFGVGLGERQHGRVARRDRLDLGVGEFLAADVLGTAGGVVAGHDLAR